MKQLSRSIPAAMRFGLQVTRDASGCWLWRGRNNRQGYGSIYINGRRMQAHRAAWVLFKGEIPHGLMVCHHCDVPACVNPDHLFLGTAKENIQDCISKGRFSPVIRYGETNNFSKLTAEQVSAIRQSSLSAKQIAPQFGISIWTVYDIRKGRSWSHI